MPPRFLLVPAAGLVAVGPGSAASSEATCPITDVFFRVAGTPSIDQAMLRWQREVCLSSSIGIPLDFTQVADAEARTRLLADEVDVAVSPLPFQPYDQQALTDAKAKASDFVYVPLTASALSCVVNLGYSDRSANLQVTPRSLAGILNHRIENLAEPWIDVDNVGNASLPRVPADDPGPFAGKPVPQRLGDPLVTAGHSNDNLLLTRYLYSDSDGQSAWEGKVTSPADVFKTGAVDELPSDASMQSVAGPYRIMTEMGVADFGGNGARVGCVDSSIAAALGPTRPLARLRNALGTFVGPSTDSVQRALALMPLGNDGIYKPVVTTAEGFTDAQAYSLPIVTYAIVPKNLDNATRATAVKLLRWIVTTGQDADHLPSGYVPLPARMVARSTSLLDDLAKVPPAPTTTTVAPTTTTIAPPPTIDTTPVTDFNNGGGGYSGGGTTDTVPTTDTLPATTTTIPGAAEVVTRPVLAVLGRIRSGGPVLSGLLGLGGVLLLAGPLVDRRRRRSGVDKAKDGTS